MKTLIVTAACVLAALAAPASALTVTITGTTSSGIDYAGLFAAAGSDLAGLSFTARYRIDASVPNAFLAFGGVDSIIESGSSVGSAPAVFASLTINGHTEAFDANYVGEIFQANRFNGVVCSGCNDELSQRAIYRDPTYNTTSELSFVTVGTHHNIVDVPEFYQPLDFTVVDPDKTGYFDIAQLGGFGATGSLSAEHITISAADPVPEPGEWAMMTAGLALMGGLARRKRTALRDTAAA